MEEGTTRRGLLTSGLMWAGLAAGYGLGAIHFLRYLLPLGARARERSLFVGMIDELAVGRSRTVRTPRGDTFVMARISGAKDASALRILSDVCPHLGCRVHWEAAKNRFFCPCHEGVFDAEGNAVGGPPAEAGQNLTRLAPLVSSDGKVFVTIKES